MKILLINNCHYPRGGADSVYLNTGSLLEQKGNKVCYFSIKNPKNISNQYSKFFVEDFSFRNLSLINKIKHAHLFIYNNEAYYQLKRLIKEEKPEIAHIHLFLGGLSNSILKALKEEDIPIVLTLHDYRLICPAYLFLDGRNKVCERCIDKFYFHCVLNKCSDNNLLNSIMITIDSYFRKYFMNPLDYVANFIFVSNFIKQKHIEFNRRFSKKNSMIYNFFKNLKDIKPNNNRGQYFLFVGRISREKGINTILEAFKKTGYPLKIVGTGPLFEQVFSSISSNIELLGYKSGDELWHIISNASFLIVPSEWYENNPLTIIEAYAHGKPVIGANIGGIPEIIEEGKTGFLFESGIILDLIEKIDNANKLSDEQYKVISKNARLFAEEKFDPEHHYNDLMGIYNSLIAK